MQKYVWMKGFFIGIIILLIGTSVSPSITAIRSEVDTTVNTIYYDIVIGLISNFQDSGTNVSFLSMFTIWLIHPIGNFTHFETMRLKWVNIQNIISKTGIITDHYIIAQFIHI